MKRVTLLLLVVSVLPTRVLAWNTPGEDFSGQLTLGGDVTNTRNPWVWKIGQEGHSVSATASSDLNAPAFPVSLPALTVLRGKTTLTTPAGREGLAPRVTYGRGVEGFTLGWVEPGVAEVMLPAMGDDNTRAGHFTFRMQALAILRHVRNGRPVYVGVYDDQKGNGLPGLAQVTTPEQTAGRLQVMFAGEGPAWLQEATVSDVAGLSRFNEASLLQVEGVYGAQVVADSGQLHVTVEVPARWRVSLPVDIEYQ